MPLSHWDGDEYSKVSLPQYEINKSFLNNYNFRGNENILDIGCGSGKTTRAMTAKIPLGTALGIDISQSMITKAITDNSLPNLSFQLGNIEHLNYESAFDLCTCFFCMQWVPNKLKAFKQVYFSLKPSGLFLMIAPLPHPILPKLRQNLISQTHWKQYFNNYKDPLIYINDTKYEEYAKIANLKIIDYQVEDTNISFPDYDRFFEFMKQMTPHLNQLPDMNKKNDFIHELLELYLSHYPTTIDGTYYVTYRLVKLITKKPK